MAGPQAFDFGGCGGPLWIVEATPGLPVPTRLLTVTDAPTPNGTRSNLHNSCARFYCSLIGSSVGGVHVAVIVEGERDEAYASGRARASTRDTLLHCASDV